jgi:hypothetical protein
MIKNTEELILISRLEQASSVSSPINESLPQPNASVSSRAELDSYAAVLTSSKQCQRAPGDGMQNSSESAYKAISLNSLSYQNQIVGSPSHQWTDFTANIPRFLSPYPCREGFSAHDSDRYMAFCGFRIVRGHLRSCWLIFFQL